MKDYAKRLYSSKTWKRCRARYAASVGGLCERCRAKGLITPGEIVHHKVYISPENVDDPTVTLNFDNLELLCRECHAQEHDGVKKRFTVDASGRVTATDWSE